MGLLVLTCRKTWKYWQWCKAWPPNYGSDRGENSAHGIATTESDVKWEIMGNENQSSALFTCQKKLQSWQLSYIKQITEDEGLGEKLLRKEPWPLLTLDGDALCAGFTHLLSLLRTLRLKITKRVFNWKDPGESLTVKTFLLYDQ